MNLSPEHLDGVVMKLADALARYPEAFSDRREGLALCGRKRLRPGEILSPDSWQVVRPDYSGIPQVKDHLAAAVDLLPNDGADLFEQILGLKRSGAGHRCLKQIVQRLFKWSMVVLQSIKRKACAADPTGILADCNPKRVTLRLAGEIKFG